MEYWGPWSSFFKKSGGTITGNVIITGTLGVGGLTTLTTLLVSGVTNLSSLITSGLASLNSLLVINATTLNTLLTTGLSTLDSLVVNNLSALNQITASGTSVLNALVTINDTLLIQHDDPTGVSPHIRLRDATVAGNINAVIFASSVGATKGAVYGASPSTVCLAPASGGQADMPSDALGVNPNWKIPNLTDALTARRMLMLHSMMFGL